MEIGIRIPQSGTDFTALFNLVNAAANRVARQVPNNPGSGRGGANRAPGGGGHAGTGRGDAVAFHQAEEEEAFKQVDKEEVVPPSHRIWQLLHGVEGLRHPACAAQLLQLSRARPG